MENKASRVVFIDVDENAPRLTVKEERASSPDEALINVKKQNKTEKIHCGECSRTFDNLERLTRHIRGLHRGENGFQCSMCPYSTYNSSMFTEHVNMHQGIKPYKCKHCPYSSVSKKYIKLHESKHGTCKECGFISRNRPELRRHIRDKGCSSAPEESFKCKDCHTTYSSAMSLRQHKRTHRQCPQCNKTLSRMLLTEHMETEHGVSNSVPQKKVKRKTFNCKLCEWTSSNLQKILLHLIHHPGQVLDYKIDVTPLVKSGILES